VTGPSELAAPLVSIVTPTFNRAPLLEGTICSVRGQSYPNVEHVVVDGGSSDDTLALLRRYESTYNLRWTSGTDAGMYDAINKGLASTSGDIVAYVNSDDRYFPWSISTAVAALAAHPDVDLVYGDVIRVDEIRHHVVPIFVPPLNARAMSAFGTLSQPAVFMRRRVVDALGGFDVGLRYVADLDFWLRASSKFRIHRTPEFLALELRHADMLSEARRQEMAAEDRGMRNRFRRGFEATSAGAFAAHIRWHWWSAQLWLRFNAAVSGHGSGWRQTIAACGPRIAPATSLMGWFPSRDSHRRSAIEWEHEPLGIATECGSRSKRAGR